MIKVIHDMPPGTVGLEAVGKVTAEDYEQVLKPALEDALTHKDVRLMYVLGEEFDTHAPEAAWADTRLWARNMNAWERIAVVSDADWLEHSLKTLGWLVPGEIKVLDR